MASGASFLTQMVEGSTRLLESHLASPISTPTSSAHWQDWVATHLETKRSESDDIEQELCQILGLGGEDVQRRDAHHFAGAAVVKAHLARSDDVSIRPVARHPTQPTFEAPGHRLPTHAPKAQHMDAPSVLHVLEVQHKQQVNELRGSLERESETTRAALRQNELLRAQLESERHHHKQFLSRVEALERAKAAGAASSDGAIRALEATNRELELAKRELAHVCTSLREERDRLSALLLSSEDALREEQRARDAVQREQDAHAAALERERAASSSERHRADRLAADLDGMRSCASTCRASVERAVRDAAVLASELRQLEDDKQLMLRSRHQECRSAVVVAARVEEGLPQSPCRQSAGEEGLTQAQSSIATPFGTIQRGSAQLITTTQQHLEQHVSSAGSSTEAPDESMIPTTTSSSALHLARAVPHASAPDAGELAIEPALEPAARRGRADATEPLRESAFTSTSHEASAKRPRAMITIAPSHESRRACTVGLMCDGAMATLHQRADPPPASQLNAAPRMPSAPSWAFGDVSWARGPPRNVPSPLREAAQACGLDHLLSLIGDDELTRQVEPFCRAREEDAARGAPWCQSTGGAVSTSWTDPDRTSQKKRTRSVPLHHLDTIQRSQVNTKAKEVRGLDLFQE